MKKYFQAPWSISELLKALITSIILVAICQGLGFYLDFSEKFDNSDFKTLISLGIFTLQWLIFFLPLLLIGRGWKKFKWKSFGLNNYDLPKTILLIARGIAIYIGISMLVTLIVLYFNVKIPGYQVQSSIFQYFENDTISIILTGLIVVMIGPFLEEVFFRGFLLRTISDKIGIIFGSIVSAGIFALLHMPWQSIIPIFILGLIINSLVIKSKSLWPAIGFHIFNNAIAFTIQLLLSKGVISVETLV